MSYGTLSTSSTSIQLKNHSLSIFNPQKHTRPLTSKILQFRRGVTHVDYNTVREKVTIMIVHSKFFRNSNKWWLILTWIIKSGRNDSRFIEKLSFAQCLKERRVPRENVFFFF